MLYVIFRDLFFHLVLSRFILLAAGQYVICLGCCLMSHCGNILYVWHTPVSVSLYLDSTPSFSHNYLSVSLFCTTKTASLKEPCIDDTRANSHECWYKGSSEINPQKGQKLVASPRKGPLSPWFICRVRLPLSSDRHERGSFRTTTLTQNGNHLAAYKWQSLTDQMR